MNPNILLVLLLIAFAPFHVGQGDVARNGIHEVKPAVLFILNCFNLVSFSFSFFTMTQVFNC